MHLISLPRHQLEISLADYARMFSSLVCPRDSSDVAEFEKEFARYVGCRHAVAVASGRLALHLILESLNLSRGDEVLVPAYNLFAVVERFCQAGLVPRFCDIRASDLDIDPACAERSITPRTRAILATHMFGHPADMEALGRLAAKHNLILLEDCAHAMGSAIAGKMAGTFGRASIFSFSVLKLVTTFGGGMIATNDDDLVFSIRRRIRELSARQPRPKGLKRVLTGAAMDFGTRSWVFSAAAWPALRLARAAQPDFQQRIMTETPHADRDFDPARVPPLHPFQARLGRSQLGQIERLIVRRRIVGAWLNEELANIPQVRLLSAREDARSNSLYYGILAERANELCRELFRRGIDAETSEYRNCADLDLYREFAADCPNARLVESRLLRLPNYPGLSRRRIARIGRVIRRFYDSNRKGHPYHHDVVRGNSI